jgi:hypothetical protein
MGPRPPKLIEAIKRLMKAALSANVEVTVLRQDLELLLTVWQQKKG